MSRITLQLDRDLIEKVKIIAEKKFSVRKITKSAGAVREALIEFVKENICYLNESQDQKKETKIETSI